MKVIISLAFILAFVVGNVAEVLRHRGPPLDRYRKDGSAPLVGFWNMFDESKFTSEAIAFHRRRLWVMLANVGFFLLFWLVSALFL